MRYDFDTVENGMVIVECRSAEEINDFIDDLFDNRIDLVPGNMKGDRELFKHDSMNYGCFRYDKDSGCIKIGSKSSYERNWNRYENYSFVTLDDIRIDDTIKKSATDIRAFIS